MVALSPFRQLSYDVQEIVLAQPDAGQLPLPSGLSPEDECDGVVAMVEGGLENIHSKAAADWMNLSAELKAAEAKAKDLEECLEAAETNLDAARSWADELQAERNALRGELSDAEQGREHANVALCDLAASLGAARDSIDAGERRMKDVVEELKTAEEEAQKLHGEVADFVDRMDQLQGDLEAEKRATASASFKVSCRARLSAGDIAAVPVERVAKHRGDCE